MTDEGSRTPNTNKTRNTNQSTEGFENYVRCKDINKHFSISSGTLRNWANSGKIRSIKDKNNGRYRYCFGDVKSALGLQTSNDPTRKTVLYARVSSNKQSEHLQNQIECLETHYPASQTYKDIGSGLNYKRKSFQVLIEEIVQGKVGKVVATYRDRICRFGFEMFEHICSINGTEVITLFQDSNTPECEMADDLLSICTYFAAKSHGSRSYSKQIKNKESEVKVAKVAGKQD